MRINTPCTHPTRALLLDLYWSCTRRVGRRYITDCARCLLLRTAPYTTATEDAYGSHPRSREDSRCEGPDAEDNGDRTHAVLPATPILSYCPRTGRTNLTISWSSWCLMLQGYTAEWSCRLRLSRMFAGDVVLTPPEICHRTGSSEHGFEVDGSDFGDEATPGRKRPSCVFNTQIVPPSEAGGRIPRQECTWQLKKELPTLCWCVFTFVTTTRLKIVAC